MGTLGPPMLSPQQQGAPAFVGAVPQAPDSGEPAAQLPPKDLNTAMMCRVGQETVQEIVGKAIDLFQVLKALQAGHHAVLLDLGLLAKGGTISYISDVSRDREQTNDNS